jgi:hypothetical protein
MTASLDFGGADLVVPSLLSVDLDALGRLRAEA